MTNHNGGREPPKSMFYGRHFSWVARVAVKIATELQLTDDQFLKLVELLVKELKQTNERFSRSTFISQVRTAALAVKQNEERWTS